MSSILRWAASVTVLAVSLCADSQTRTFTVRDDIGMARFSTPAQDGNLDIVKATSDGEFFAIVTTRGLLISDLIESDINVFTRKEIERYLSSGSTQHPPRPLVVARIRSYPHHSEPAPYAPVIVSLRWAPDQRHLFFRAENLQGHYQLYEVAANGSELRALTPPDRSVNQFDVISGKIVYTFSTPEQLHNVNIPGSPDAVEVTGKRLQDILFPNDLKDIRPEVFHLGMLAKSGEAWRDHTIGTYSVQEIRFLSFLFPFSLSPHGDKLITLTPVLQIPKEWNLYQPAAGYEVLRFGTYDALRSAVDNILRPVQYSVIDVSSGKVIYTLGAPNARALAYSDDSRASWSSDGKRALLTNTFMPLPKDPQALHGADHPCAVATIDLPGFAGRCVVLIDSRASGRQHVLGASFMKGKDDVSVLLGDGVVQTTLNAYHLGPGGWQRVSSRTLSRSGESLSVTQDSQPNFQKKLSLFVREDLNTPPVLWVADDAGKAERSLWDPNPQLKEISLGTAERYRWKDHSGYEWSGALVKPSGFVEGRRYPLVIQMYSFNPSRFLTDGMDPTAFAARHLAGAGIVVLQVQKKRDTLSDSDPQDALEAYRSAIQSLSEKGLIDPKRVGAVGFSWTCWYIENALAKDPSLFAAATVADGLDDSYMQYHLYGEGSYSIRHQMETIYGGAPLGSGLKAWLDRAPGFHLDRVQAPLRIEAINPFSLLGEWELYSSLRMQQKPVDLIYFPNGAHIHQKPMARLESQQGDVDWFRFWLQGYEDPDPSKRKQYQRWEKMKQVTAP
jgi:dipeptidyl aminopeptidase/acylaminoacyl peptidase